MLVSLLFIFLKYRAIITAYDTFDRQSYLRHWMFCFMLLSNSSLWHLVLLLSVSHINSWAIYHNWNLNYSDNWNYNRNCYTAATGIIIPKLHIKSHNVVKWQGSGKSDMKPKPRMQVLLIIIRAECHKWTWVRLVILIDIFSSIGIVDENDGGNLPDCTGCNDKQTVVDGNWMHFPLLLFIECDVLHAVNHVKHIIPIVLHSLQKLTNLLLICL